MATIADHLTCASIDNEALAARLEEVAELLEAQEASSYRVQAYRNGANVLRSLDRPAAQIVADEGADGLMKLPRIGPSLARMIEQMVHSGRLPLLEHLRGEAGTERLLQTVSGVGPELAARIHDQLHIQTLADLEAAAWDGRLATVNGMGARRIRAIRESLAGRFSRGPGRLQAASRDEPPVWEILQVDDEYRRKAAAGELPMIAPRRFNPTREAWLPVLHTTVGARHYTALYSNTARAHQLGRTDDWVVIYRDDHSGDGRWTVITARSGLLNGRRIVRSREEECTRHYGIESISSSRG